MLSAHGFISNAGTNGSGSGSAAARSASILSRKASRGPHRAIAATATCRESDCQDTMALTDLFTKFNGGTAPRRVYLTGTSMGGHVTLLGMHEFPTAFAGGLAMCPSGPELFDFFTAVGAAAEAITGVAFKEPSTLQRIWRG